MVRHEFVKWNLSQSACVKYLTVKMVDHTKSKAITLNKDDFEGYQIKMHGRVVTQRKFEGNKNSQKTNQLNN